MSKQPVSSLFVAYVLARFGIFAVLTLIFFWVGFKGWPGLITAAAVSIVISFFALRPMRDKLTERIAASQEARLSNKESFRTAGTDEDGSAT